MNTLRIALIATSALAASACTTMNAEPAATTAPPAAAAPSQSEHDRLFALPHARIQRRAAQAGQ
jgi:hypothetical protein